MKLHKNLVLIVGAMIGTGLISFSLVSGFGFHALTMQLGMMLLFFYPTAIVLEWIFGSR